MTLKKSARDYLIETAKMLMHRKPLAEITVAEILSVSGVSRTTFYKLFNDKQDLVEHVFIDEVSSAFFYDVDRPLYDREVDILRNIDANRPFYQEAVKSDEFVKVWMEKALDSNRFYMRIKLADRGIPAEALDMCAHMMSNTFAGASLDWIRHPCGLTPEEYARMLVVYLWHGLSAFADDFGQEPVEGPVESTGEDDAGEDAGGNRPAE